MSRVRFDWVGLILIAWSVLARATTMAEPLPGWDADPTRIPIAIIGLGPTGSLLLDAMAWLGAGLVLTNKRSRRSEPLALLALAGALLVIAHTALVDAQNVEAIRIGSSWAAAWVSFAAIASVAHRPLVRTTLGSLFLACVLLLGAKAIVQVFVEHPLMLAQFDSDRAGNLIAQGFQPGSEQALVYERRLRQPDPTGWFGLSNVLATFLAMGSVSLVLAGFMCKKAARTAIFTAAAGIGAVLFLTGSKAGIGVAVLGVMAFAATTFLPRKPAVASVLAIIAVPTAAVVIRGLTGIPEGERSLLFRWFYMQGAAGVSLDALPLGTGPAGFQDAYMLHKPPLATEDVTSPHMVLWDYAATLGLVGLPLIAAILWSAFLLARNLLSTTRHAPSTMRLRQVRPLLIIGMLAPIFIGVWLESEATTIESALGRLVGVLAWGGLALLLVWVGMPTKRMLAIAGIVLLCHAQLDMAMIIPGSAPLAISILALAIPGDRIPKFRLPRFVPAGLALLGLGITAWLAPGVWRWESLLRTSSGRFAEILTARETLLAGPATPADVRAIDLRMVDAMEGAFEELSKASEWKPADGRAASEGARIGATLASARRQAGRDREAADDLDRTVTLLVHAFEARPRAGLAAQIGNLELMKADWAEQAGSPAEQVRVLRERAIQRLETAARLAPRSSRHPATLAFTLSEQGDSAQAAVWAGRAIELDDAMQLDPLSALPEETRRRLERIARGP